MSSPYSNTNVFSLMVDDYTNQWYHSKSREQRRIVLDQLRSFLRQLKLSEEDTDPDLKRLKAELEAIREDRESHEASIQELDSKLFALQARVEQLQAVEDEKKRRRQEENSENTILDYWKTLILEEVFTLQHVREVASGQASAQLFKAVEQQHYNKFGRDPKLTARQVCQQILEVF